MAQNLENLRWSCQAITLRWFAGFTIPLLWKAVNALMFEREGRRSQPALLLRSSSRIWIGKTRVQNPCTAIGLSSICAARVSRCWTDLTYDISTNVYNILRSCTPMRKIVYCGCIYFLLVCTVEKEHLAREESVFLSTEFK